MLKKELFGTIQKKVKMTYFNTKFTMLTEIFRFCVEKWYNFE